MIDNDTVRKVAFLSRLKIDDGKIEAIKDEFNGILDWFEQLEEVDTTAVEPLFSVNGGTLAPRADEVLVGGTQAQAEAVLANAPQKEFGYFTVPKVIGGGEE